MRKQFDDAIGEPVREEWPRKPVVSSYYEHFHPFGMSYDDADDVEPTQPGTTNNANNPKLLTAEEDAEDIGEGNEGPTFCSLGCKKDYEDDVKNKAIKSRIWVDNRYLTHEEFCDIHNKCAKCLTNLPPLE